MLMSLARPHRWIVAAAAFALIGAALLLFLLHRPRFTADEISARMVVAIQRESRESFLVTGSIDMTVTLSHENTRTLLPGLLDVSLGDVHATVQVPGRVYYGIDTRKLEQANIRISGDTVFMNVPPPQVLSVDPNLQRLRVWTSKGWLRTNNSVRDAERAAIRNINAAFARQASAYVATSAQPRVNTAAALERTLEPVLVSVGMRHPHFRFNLEENLLKD